MLMRDDWINVCLDLAKEPADFFSGARKIICGRSVIFDPPEHDLYMPDAGYTKSKTSMLKRLYMHQESIDAAITGWERRKKQRKYGSVGFTCYNHLLKSDPTKGSKRASVMGPCIQSVTLTYTNKHTTHVDAFYRTTELFKKFPADLVFLRDDLLSQFDFEAAPIDGITFHFANITIHPMYFVTLIPPLGDDLVEVLEELREADEFFHKWVVKWTARYFIPEFHRGIQKFAQAMRVQMDADKRVTDEQRAVLIPYLEKHHPGFNNEYEDPDDVDE